MAYSIVRYTGNGTTASYTFPFQYLSQDHVNVKVDGVDAVFTFLNANTVTISPTPALNSVIEIKRVTPKTTPIVNFTDGSVLLERDLDLLATFDLYVAQESADAVAETISVDPTGRWDGQLKRLGNLAPAIAPDEAVIKQTLDYEYPAVAIVAGARADLAIVGSDLGVATAQVSDLGSITDPVTSNPASGGSKIVVVADNITDIQSVANNLTAIQNAQGNANSAAASATAAATSATSASGSASAASTSAAAALSSKNAAAASETAAATSASSAATSATTATGQASAASGSASAAATSASNAATAATQASSSASSASTSATNAASSATSAASSATSASSSASTATSQASAASTSAANAATSATAAASSASSASSSATTATSQAAVATTKATDAANSATAAASSATSASTSASSASSSLQTFRAVFCGAFATNPTVDGNGNALSAGDLYFNTVANEMRVYNGTTWQPQAASPDTLTVRRFVATAGQTTYAVSGGYRVNYTYVYVNGVMLDDTDIVATDGANITFNTPLALNDEVRVISFKAIGTLATTDITGFTAAAAAAAPVQSVNSQTGTVTLTTSNVSEGSNLYFTNSRASAAAPVQSVAGRTGAVVIANTDVSGLGSLATKSSVADTDLASILDLGALP